MVETDKGYKSPLLETDKSVESPLKDDQDKYEKLFLNKIRSNSMKPIKNDVSFLNKTCLE